LKPTAKGNLPRKFCWHAALSYWGEETYLEDTRFGDINKEEDVLELHVTRLVAGLIRKYKGKFILSRDFDAREPAPKGWVFSEDREAKQKGRFRPETSTPVR
jgi:hypothetical protein